MEDQDSPLRIPLLDVPIGNQTWLSIIKNQHLSNQSSSIPWAFLTGFNLKIVKKLFYKSVELCKY